MAQLLDGKATAKSVRGELKREIKRLVTLVERPPQSVFIQVGENPASTTYVNLKHKMAERIGCVSTIARMADSITQDELLECIQRYNEDRNVHGILVQLPLPEHIDESVIVQAISPRKDVDCFHPENVGRMIIGLPGPKPATPLGIVTLLDAYGIDVKGLNVTVVGRSNLVGKPLGIMLLLRHGTVTYCHTRTRDLAAECKRADLLIAAAGRAGIVTPEMIKPGAVVVDVGTNFIPAVDENGQPVLDENGQPKQQQVGDVEFNAAEQITAWISPVPGGVGPMTIASVLSNTVTLYKLIEGVD
ncbi:bifunctional 5,10-methylenetetrahydrofolate dehydrogenase/5,10-methenyltetrahydrofolate cyclohydrolase [bacterium]|nr:bifunctional 5,10-methylenetetrahydrofolate dehydrogenase/5,10-methenyltetrahydrofolate cyclohydrolase [bacterium]